MSFPIDGGGKGSEDTEEGGMLAEVGVEAEQIEAQVENEGAMIEEVELQGAQEEVLPAVQDVGTGAAAGGNETENSNLQQRLLPRIIITTNNLITTNIPCCLSRSHRPFHPA